jgi:F-type H+-transporting ATPase subunit a
MWTVIGSGDPYKHTWDGWTLHFYGFELDLSQFAILHSLGVTKAVVMMLCGALILCTIGIIAGNAAKRAQAAGTTSKGFGAVIEVLIAWVRNDLVKPAMPHHYKRPWFVATFCTFFLLILTWNLLGLLPQPFGFTATGGGIWVTGALAFGGTFLISVGAGIAEHGPLGIIAHLAPPSPWWVRWPLLLPIETIGVAVKSVSLTLRLAANMTAGHIILAVLVGFLEHEFSASMLLVWPAAAGGVLAITVFEIVIAFIQAYIFTALSCVFVGQMVSHEH